jgi:hypothetical protein
VSSACDRELLSNFTLPASLHFAYVLPIDLCSIAAVVTAAACITDLKQ